MTMPFSRFTEYFLVVAKTGSLRKAAEQLFISVSAVHRQIVLAEESLGVQLFERLPSGLKLTLAGELLYADALRWQKDFQQTCIRFDEIQGLNRGSIEFGLISALTEGFIIESIVDIQQQYPWLNFNIQVDDSHQIAEKIMLSELDFGLILDPVQHNHLDVLSFIEMPLGLVVSPAHALSKHTPRFILSDTHQERHIVAQPPLIIHDRVDAIYKKHQLNPQQRIECSDIQMMISLLKQNLGVAIMSYLDVYTYVKRQELFFIPIKEQRIQPVTVALCVASKRQLSRAAQIFIQQVIYKMEAIKSHLTHDE
ncbi:MAG: LysR family transcriptional regulator [Acinetobacter sp.]